MDRSINLIEPIILNEKGFVLKLQHKELGIVSKIISFNTIFEIYNSINYYKKDQKTFKIIFVAQISKNVLIKYTPNRLHIFKLPNDASTQIANIFIETAILMGIMN